MATSTAVQVSSPVPAPAARRPLLRLLVYHVNGSVFVLFHILALLAIVTGVSWRAAVIGFVLYWARMFALTGGYHRYFAHRTYRTSRTLAFLIALLATSALQKGPLWWSSVHRRHHRESDGPGDAHSPRRGFWWSHMGWFLWSGDSDYTDLDSVRDLARYPELAWLDRYHWVAPLVLLALCFAAAGWSGVTVGFALSTAVLNHSVFTINSLAHIVGRRRFSTTDDSKNQWLLAVITMGEGWHNNHHRYMGSVRQGFYWWQIDASYYVVRALAAVGLVWGVREPPPSVLAEGRRLRG